MFHKCYVAMYFQLESFCFYAFSLTCLPHLNVTLVSFGQWDLSIGISLVSGGGMLLSSHQDWLNAMAYDVMVYNRLVLIKTEEEEEKEEEEKEEEEQEGEVLRNLI